MSTEEAAAADEVCASCGTAAVDDVKLMKCACNLVKYCSVACQKNHRQQHKKVCRKRLAEMRDDDLFTQPDESHWGECPICCLPLPICASKSAFMECCCKVICNGCHFANQKREYKEGLEERCAFCREPAPNSKEESQKRVMNRVKKNCPVAMCEMGKTRRREGDYETAFNYWTKAAALGDAESHYELSVLYHKGEGVEKDEKKAFYHLEQAAIGGHPNSRHILGCEEEKKGSYERAKKHWIIAANLGVHDSLEELRILYAHGHASKDDYAGALHAYQAAADEMKSKEREEAEAFYKL